MAEVGTILQILIAKAQNRRVAKGPILESLLTWLLLHRASHNVLRNYKYL